MDGAELQAILEAAARELAAVTANIADGHDQHTEAARHEVRDAQEAVEEAARLWAETAASPTAAAGSGKHGVPPGSDHREAHAMRAGAMRSRDVAEARLRTLREKRADLLEQLQRRTEERFQGNEELQEHVGTLAAREADLLARCEEMETRARTIQGEIRQKSRRIVERGARGHELSRYRRLLVRQHNRSIAENTRAREILALEQHTHAHLQAVSEQCDSVYDSLATEQRNCAERTKVLQLEWAEQEAKFEEEAAALEAHIVELQQHYGERWKASEIDVRARLDEKSRQLAEARVIFGQQCAELDSERESEAAAAREQIEAQKLRLIEARREALAEMEEKLNQKREELQAKADAEHRRCDSLRNQHLRRADDHARECEHYRTNIGKVRENYGSGQLSELNPLPRLTATSGRPLI